MSNVTELPPSTFTVHHPPHDLRALIEAALLRSGNLANRNLWFEVRESEVVLRGVVRSYYQKQVAQESLRSISGLRKIHNEIEVIAAERR